jgi:phosphoglucosamine mutase
LKELATVMTKLPQLMINVKNVDKARAGTDEGVLAAVAEASAELGETGRVLLRPSGTEALVRVMVEAADMPTAERICKHLAAVVEERLAVEPAV